MEDQTGETAEQETGWAWHVHHEVLCEPLTEPIEARIDYIRLEKPLDEQATRLRLLQPVRGPLPVTFVQAHSAYDHARSVFFQARSVYDQAEAAYTRAWDVYDQDMLDAMPALLVLHAVECPNCPWDGKTIFLD